MVIVLGYLAGRSALADGQPPWICSELSIQRDGDRYLVCGVGQADQEPEARIRALDHAQKEFDRFCALSSDCRDRQVNLQPARTDCRRSRTTGAIECRRAIYYQLGAPGPRLSQDTSVLEDDIESLEEQISLRKKQLDLARQSKAQREQLKKLEEQIRSGDLSEDDSTSNHQGSFLTPNPLGQWDPSTPWSLQLSSGLLPSRPTFSDRPASISAAIGGVLQRRLFDRLGIALEFRSLFNGYSPDEYFGEMDAGPGFSATLWTIGLPLHLSADPYKSWSITPIVGKLRAQVTTATPQDEEGLYSYLTPYSVSTSIHTGMVVGAHFGYSATAEAITLGWRTGFSFLTPSSQQDGWSNLGLHLTVDMGLRF